MSTFPVYHGITLADNSWIENFRLEALSADPVPLEAGRAWFNTTDKVFRQSTLDANGAVVVKTFATVEELAASVSTLNATIAALTSDLAAEVSRATAAESVLTSGLATEVSDRSAADALINARIDALGSAFNYVGVVAGGADAASAFDLSTLSQKDVGDYYKVTTEGYFKVGTGAEFFAKVGDGLVWTSSSVVDKIDNTDSQVFSGNAAQITVTGSTDTGFYVSISATFEARMVAVEDGLAAEIARATAAEGVLTSDLADEVARATAAEGVLTSAVTAEQARAEGVEASLQAQIDDEVAARTTAVANEASARIAADATLTTNLASEVSRATAAEGVLSADLATEVQARIDGDAALDTRVTTVEGQVNGKIGDLTTLTTTAKDTIVAAINELDADLAAEVAAREAAVAAEQAAREAADTQLTTDLAAEVTRATAAEGTLTTNLATEVARAQAAESTLTTNLAAEVTRATGAESVLQAAIDAEAASRATADTNLQDAIDAEAASRTAADTTLQANIDAEAATRAANDATLQSNITAEAAARLAGDLAQTDALAAEHDARIAADAALDARVTALGNAFNYIGALEGGLDAAGALDLSTLPEGGKDSGDYYKVTVAGYFKIGAAGTAFYANVGDGLVWNTFGSVDKIDNTDSNVAGTADYISVNGSADTGFTVDIDAVFKGRVSTLESGLTSETAARVAADAQLTSDLSAEVTRATGVEGALAGLTTDAKNNLVAAINEVDAHIDAEVLRATAAESTLTTDLSNEVARAEAAEAAIAADLAAETARAEAAEGVLTTNLAAEVTRATAAEAAVASDLADEIARATAAEAAIAADLAAEIARATAAETAEAATRAAADTAESTARSAADATLTADLAAEVARAEAAEADLQGQVGVIGDLTTTATDLVSAVNEVKALAGEGTQAIKDAYNATVATYVSTVAATSHTFAHGLNASFVDVGVFVQRSNGTFYNDIVSVEQVDSNTVKVYLSTALNVKLICRSAVTL